jgi:putative hemolysin
MKINKNIIYVIISVIVIILLVFSFFFFGNNDSENLIIEDDYEQQAENICLQSGGKIDFRLNRKGEEYRICLFGENRECSLAEIIENDCPEGGKMVIFAGPYNYCLSLGGDYLEKENALEEEKWITGNCLLKSGEVYNAFELYKNRFKIENNIN